MPIADIDASYLFYSVHEFMSSFQKFGKFAPRWDEDFTSSLNSRYSVLVVMIMTLMISTKQYVGDPIACMPPPEFSLPMVEYTNHLCWVSNTYYLPFSQRPLMEGEPREQMLTYYQWIPLILIVQGVLFFLPSLVWRTQSKKSGLCVNKIVVTLSAMDNLNPEIRDGQVYGMVQHIDRALCYQLDYKTNRMARLKHHLATHCFLCCGKIYGNYLTTLCVVTKVMYILSSVGQLFLLVEFIGDGYLFYGIDALKDIISKKYHNSKLFPRITLCDVIIRQFSNNQMFTVQCALPINLFNEKLYLFLWFWLGFISIVNIYSLISFVWRSFYTSRVDYVKPKLMSYHNCMSHRSTHHHGDISPKLLQIFVRDYLRQDGRLVLQLLEYNSSDSMVTEVIGQLWQQFCKWEIRREAGERELCQIKVV